MTKHRIASEREKYFSDIKCAAFSTCVIARRNLMADARSILASKQSEASLYKRAEFNHRKSLEIKSKQNVFRSMCFTHLEDIHTIFRLL